jgi:hypothetical protein
VGIFTPGGLVTAQTDFIGPLPSTAHWIFSLHETGDETYPLWTLNVHSQVSNQSFVMMRNDNSLQSVSHAAVPSGTSVTLAASLIDDSTGIEIDSGSQAATWDATAGLGAQIFVKPTGQGQGLTSTQSSQLASINSRTQAVLGDTAPTITDAEGAHAFTLGEMFTGKALDQLTLHEVSSGPGPGPFSSFVDTWFFGVIIRVSQLPAGAFPLTPAQDYYPADLAVLRVFRGSDMEQRFGIHTVSVLIPFHNLYGGVVLNESLLFGNPPTTSIEVEFALGAEGQVFLMRFP